MPNPWALIKLGVLSSRKFRLQSLAYTQWIRGLIMNRLLILVPTLFLGGCLSSGFNLSNLSGFNLSNLIGDDVRMTPEHAMFVKTAAVITLVDPQPRTHWVASSLKDSNLESLYLNDWDARQTTTTLMEGRLKQKGFTVVSIANDITAKEAYSSNSSFAQPERIRDRLVAIGQARGVDMLVVIYRQQVRDFLSKSSQKVIGYGIYKRHSEEQIYAYSAVRVVALNVEKGFVMGQADGQVKFELPNSAWQQNFETDQGPLRLSPARGEVARDSIIKALADATIIAAQEAGLSN